MAQEGASRFNPAVPPPATGDQSPNAVYHSFVIDVTERCEVAIILYPLGALEKPATPAFPASGASDIAGIMAHFDQACPWELTCRKSLT